MIDDTLYDAFGQRQISTMFTQLNQYRVVLEVEPEFQKTSPLTIYEDLYIRPASTRPRGSTVCRSTCLQRSLEDRRPVSARRQPPGTVSRW